MTNFEIPPLNSHDLDQQYFCPVSKLRLIKKNTILEIISNRQLKNHSPVTATKFTIFDSLTIRKCDTIIRQRVKYEIKEYMHIRTRRQKIIARTTDYWTWSLVHCFSLRTPRTVRALQMRKKQIGKRNNLGPYTNKTLKKASLKLSQWPSVISLQYQ